MPLAGGRQSQRILATLVGLAAFALASGSAAGRVLLVGTYNGIAGKYTSIQAAVDKAQPGDWIQLFDVTPGGTERLISRGAYRLTNNQTGQIVFQLHGNGYEFPAGDEVKLVLLGSDAPYLRKSNDQTFTVRVSKVTISLPTR